MRLLFKETLLFQTTQKVRAGSSLQIQWTHNSAFHVARKVIYSAANSYGLKSLMGCSRCLPKYAES